MAWKNISYAVALFAAAAISALLGLWSWRRRPAPGAAIFDSADVEHGMVVTGLRY